MIAVQDYNTFSLLPKMAKNILMPGGIGYIGAHVAIELLLDTQHHLTIADNYLNSSP